ncbi:hypothetical protein NPS53_08725 [Pseudomonas putida]|uniref:tetratricopeptide repeat protein n=1 Tax=Pseudomonas putida TaxID=303 RepID=UPI0023632D33|nr:hypothetical protein [Pseudomonas putida]MDD2139657.1 hypothetical protein [Pseudomonas putida]HDS1721581.1 sel1 repeat family protein [Pseudomonas putida]
MLPRFLPLPISLAILAGCTATNNYDSAANPFDEPVPVRAAPAPPLSTIPAPVDHRLSPPQPSVIPQQDEAVSFAVTDVPLQIGTTGSVDTSVNPHAQEMIDEANRLGALGDVQGKSELLTQAGYSGSPKAFYDLARMYLDGTLPTDMTQAVKYVTMAHEAGFSEATRVLGMLYIRGQGVMEDVGYGRKLLELASKSSPRAAREYGQLLTNQFQPHLNDPDLGMQFLKDAADRGDRDAALSLSAFLAKTGRALEAEQVAAQADVLPSPVEHAAPALGVKGRAMRGDTSAMFMYAQQVMLRKIPTSDPEFTAYCWLSVAKQLGSREAGNELDLISGVRSISDRKHPGRLDQCIADLHYQVSGTN